MTNQIKHVESGVVYDVAEKPTLINGIWECGDRRFTDEVGSTYEPLTPPPMPPTVGPIIFQLLWTVDERVAIDELVETNKGVKNFKRMIDDPRTDAVVMALPSIQASIQKTLEAMAEKGTISQADVDTRKAEILAGVMK